MTMFAKRSVSYGTQCICTLSAQFRQNIITYLGDGMNEYQDGLIKVRHWLIGGQLAKHQGKNSGRV